MPLPDPSSCAPQQVRDFATTRWSIVLLAGDERSSRSGQALETLCRSYWYPLYSFVRRQGHDTHTAQDLTQEFFSRLLAGHGLETVNPSKGKFRSFLLASLKHFLANEWNRLQTQRRGGGQLHFSLDAASAEERYRLETADELTPEKVFERRWAETVIDSVTRRLEEEYMAAGMVKRFEELKGFLLGSYEPTSYSDAAGRLNISDGAVRTAIYRMRQRYGELFRAEIADTVNGLREMQEEVRHFLKALAG